MRQRLSRAPDGTSAARPRRGPRQVAAAFVGLAVALVPGTALAWQEAHQTSDDVKVTVDEAGVARFEHEIGYRIVRGPLRSFELLGVEKNAAPVAEASVTGPDGREHGAHVEVVPEKHALRVSVDDPRALMRGAFVFHVKYAVDLVASQELVKDGAMWRLSWTAPLASEGFDSGRVAFDLPAAPTPPRAVDPRTGSADERVLPTLKRTTGRDELALVRPHVARGEAPSWTLRLDPKAFPKVQAPELRPPPLPPPPPPQRAKEITLALALSALALFFGLLVRHKELAFARALANRGEAPVQRAREHASLRSQAPAHLGLVPIPAGWRGLFAGAALGGAVAVEILLSQPTAGAVCVALAMLFAALRPSRLRAPARGPGKWLAIRPEEAFVKAKPRFPHWLDVGCARGKGALLALLALAAGLAFFAVRLAPEAPFLVLLDIAAFLPIFFTGRSAELPPDPARASASWQGAVFRRLKKVKDARVVPWVRVPLATTDPDELRLLALPRAAMPGLYGIEVGVAWGPTMVGYASAPEVLVRVEGGSAADVRMALLVPDARPAPGRRHDERVYRLSPHTGTRRGTALLVVRLLAELADRRQKVAELARFRGPERRAA